MDCLAVIETHSSWEYSDSRVVGKPGLRLDGTDNDVQNESEWGEHDGDEVDGNHDEVLDLAQVGVVEHP